MVRWAPVRLRLVQAIASAAGVDRRDVVSPTFVLVQQYEARVAGSPLPIYHVDAYRMRDVDEFIGLGGEEYLAGPGWVLIEWAERIAGCLPDELLELTLLVTGDNSRSVQLVGRGLRYAALVERLKDVSLSA